MSVSYLNTTSSTKFKGPVPDFIINHVAPIHSGSQWLQTKRQSQEEMYGEASLVGGYKQFREDIKGIVPDSRVFTDPLRTLAYGTDASFYRLVPKIVVKVHDEAEMIKLIQVANKNKTPITFRAGGTSLSGQAITDSILLKLGHTWRYKKIEDDGKLITVEPGWILGQVNRMLAPYGRKLGPDPSSIESCWIGGVVANNSSGMCCGVNQNTYHTIKVPARGHNPARRVCITVDASRPDSLVHMCGDCVQDLRLVLHDGSVLDTADAARCVPKLTPPLLVHVCWELEPRGQGHARLLSR